MEKKLRETKIEKMNAYEQIFLSLRRQTIIRSSHTMVGPHYHGLGTYALTQQNSAAAKAVSVGHCEQRETPSIAGAT